jgi:tRNA 5-methylaminomethyl-2-thiouridine biosynthesis bifunctional protein
MNSHGKIIPEAQIEWRHGQPYALAFDDVYFSTDNGLLETDYVFLQGNDLARRWQTLQSQSFTIAETGFGSGLNFLCAAQLWLASAPASARLHFISVEKYPLSLADITQALQLWPTLAALSAPLLKEYVALISGTPGVMLYEQRIELSLLIGDASDCLQQLTSASSAMSAIDAWFLDGFSPAKNPVMWQPPLFAQMAALSTPTTTFATFSSAGNVRRGLSAAGFSVSKKPGFGKKREMIHGHFSGQFGAQHHERQAE